MALVETTRLSSKGQVVLPLAIRHKLHLTHGVKFVVVGDRDTVILKKVTPPSLRDVQPLLHESRQYASQVGLHPSDIQRAIRKTRRRRRGR